MRTMFDAVDWWKIPDNAEMVAGYVTGPYAWPAEAWAKFANRPHVRICTGAAGNTGNCLDVERTDATPVEVPDWLIKARARGEDPSVYMSASAWPAVRRACMDRGVAEPHYWVANWDNYAGLPTGAVAKQYRAAGIYDVSVVADYWPGVDNAKPSTIDTAGNIQPLPIATVATNEDDDMSIAVCIRSAGTGVDPDGGGAQYLCEGGRSPSGIFIPLVKRHIGDPNDLSVLYRYGFKTEACDGFLLDRAEDGPAWHTGEYPKQP